MLSRRSILAAAIIVACGSTVYLQPFRSREHPRIFSGTATGVAIGGYDPVAYFVQGAPTPGRNDITTGHDGTTWRFANEDNRAVFRTNPDRYVPRYGGYCAYAVAGGGTAGSSPEHWHIHDGKLYLNASARVHAKWLRDPTGYIARADANWPSLRDRSSL
jgi:hypothetical protein